MTKVYVTVKLRELQVIKLLKTLIIMKEMMNKTDILNCKYFMRLDESIKTLRISGTIKCDL